MTGRRWGWVAAAALGACTHATREPALPLEPSREAPSAPTTAATAAPLPAPPPPSPPVDPPLAVVAVHRLDGGLTLALHERHELPLVSLTLVVPGGSALDGQHPGIAELVARAIELTASAAWPSGWGAPSCAASLTDLRCVAEVTSDQTPRAIALLAEAVRKPRLVPMELRRATRSLAESTEDRLAGDAGRVAVAHRELFASSTERHPHSLPLALPGALRALDVTRARSWHERHVLPEGAALVVVGDVNEGAVVESVQGAFGGWSGRATAAPAASRPASTRRHPITLVHTGSSEAAVTVGLLGPERDAEAAPAVVLGAEVAVARLARRNVAASFRTSSVSSGPVPYLFDVTAPAGETALATRTLLGVLDSLGSEPMTDDEIATATRRLTGRLLRSVSSVRGLAGTVADRIAEGSSPSATDDERRQLRSLDPALVRALAPRHLRRGEAVVVVTGDAEVLGPELSALGRVHVVDPRADLGVIRTLEATGVAGAPTPPAGTP